MTNDFIIFLLNQGYSRDELLVFFGGLTIVLLSVAFCGVCALVKMHRRERQEEAFKKAQRRSQRSSRILYHIICLSQWQTVLEEIEKGFIDG